ncbi:class I SAM-dependent methyltransferase [Seohaeicola saemankumensis]|nr:DUF938 domain-containing protein [Seohaeicola saemankumensis]MCA0872302.1 class I SAM-dependent methyltransferase [Seohaeicola saemankumensis]
MTKPPIRHSQADPGTGARLVAPSAARNLEPLCALLEQVAPPRGRALEIASGTGQHVAGFAARLPGLHWQPSDPDATRRASIDAHAADTGLDRIAPAVDLDAARPGWSADHAGMDLIVVINLLHLIPMAAVETALAEAARALAPGGRIVIYGPFMRGGALTSDGDIAFHASLRAENPAIGYKDDFDIMDLLQAAGLDMAQVVEMPANNLALIAEKPKT